MDKIESLGNQLSQITLYDIKSMYNQAKNMVLNVSEMEAKVREATNDDPWGASSTLMQEIAQGTFNFQQFNEIMPCIYSRFMDKEARQWREIYKALQLLEYIVKHGSERVVDDARSHLSTIKMLRNFHYIDEKGKDQGINVRNRAKEIAELLSDVDRIRAERRKAKVNRNKYVGTGNDGMSFSGGSGRYGGFGSDSYSSGSGGGSGSRSYGGGYDRDYNGGSGGGYGGSSSTFRDSSDRRGFEEYNAGDDEVHAPRRTNSLNTHSSVKRSNSGSNEATSRPAQKAPEKVVDLLGFDDDNDFSSPSTTAPAVAAPVPAQKEKALPAVTSNPLDDDDDFADFQTAPAPAAAAPVTTSTAKPTVYEFLNNANTTSAPAPTMTPIAPLQSQSGAGSLFGAPIKPTVTSGIGSMGMSTLTPTSPRTNTFGATTARPTATSSSFSTPTPGTAAHAKTGSSAGGFDDLWSLSLGTPGNKTTGTGLGGKSIKQLEKEKSQAGIWGGGVTNTSGLGSFGNLSGGGSNNGNMGTSSGGVDDLLL